MRQMPNISSLFEGKRAAIDPRALIQDLAPTRIAAEADPHSVRIIGPMVQFGGWVDGYDLITDRVIEALAEQGEEITVYIDSPGGDVAGLESAIDAICAARDNLGKTIHVQAGELLASAAYWLAIGICNGTMTAPKSAEIGSIGVFSVVVDETERLKNMGISVKLIRNPDGKAPGIPADPIPDIALQREKDRVDEIANRFFDAVAAARGIPAQTVAAWNGATFTAAQALDLGLIGGVLGSEAAVAHHEFDQQDLIEAAVTSETEADPQQPPQAKTRITPARAQTRSATKTKPKPAPQLRRSGAKKGKAKSMKAKTEEMKRKAEDEPNETETDGAKTTAADVGSAAASCAAACEACAAACVDGTVDEAMAAITSMVEACGDATSAAAEFFAAIGITEEEPAPEEEPTAEEEEEEEDKKEDLATRLARVERRIEADDRQRAMSKKRISAEQRAKLAAMTAAEFYAAIEFLPDRYDNKLANDITPNATRGGGIGLGLSASDLKRCKAKNVDPEKLAMIKAGLAGKNRK